MRGRLEQRFVVFSGGVRKTDATLTGAPSKFPDGKQPGRAPGSRGRREELAGGGNVIYDRRTGLLRRRDAHIRHVTLPAAGGSPATSGVLTSLMVGSGFPAGDPKQALVSDGSNVWRYDGTFGFNVTPIITGLAAGSLWHSVMAPVSGGQGPMYMMNGSYAAVWTGAGAAAWTASSGTLPVGKYLAVHGNRVWSVSTNLAVSDPGSSFGWSDIGDPRSWPAANVAMLDPNDGDTLTGVGRIGPYLLLFKRRKTWVVYDLDTGANRQLSAAIGCISHRSIAETPHGTLFMSERGPAICDGSTIKLIEDKLDLMSQITLTDTQLDLTRWVTAASTGDDYYVNVTPELITGPFAPFLQAREAAHYDIINDAWWPFSAAMEQMTVWDGLAESELWALDAGGLPGAAQRSLARMFANKGSDQVADQDPVGTVSITATARLRDIDFGTDQRKLLRSLTVEGNALFEPFLYADGVGVIGPVRDLTSTTGVKRGIWPRPAGLAPAQRIGVEFVAGLSGGAVDPPPFEIAAVTVHADERAR